ncbi:MAG: maleylpyruvate isomerase family mycothiol-dependent enzyme [Acidimicrobiales bacterium]
MNDDAIYKTWLADATDRFAGVVAASDLTRPVPSCPGWDVAELVEHVVFIHAWVEKILATAAAQSAGDDHPAPPRDAADAALGYAHWYRQRAAAMRTAMDAYPPEAPCWNFSGVNMTYGFWPRRQTHEVSVHTVDASLTGGEELTIDPLVAADGIDELLRVFGVRMAQRGAPADLTAHVTIVPSDIDRAWTVSPPQVNGGAVLVDDGANGDAAASLGGTASDLLLALWKRLPADRLTVTGDAAVAAAYVGSRLVP